jgi:hypothetical protein
MSWSNDWFMMTTTKQFEVAIIQIQNNTLNWNDWPYSKLPEYRALICQTTTKNQQE